MSTQAPSTPSLRLATEIRRELQLGSVIDLTTHTWFAIDNNEGDLAEDVFRYDNNENQGACAYFALPCPGYLTAPTTPEEDAALEQAYSDGTKGRELFADDLRNAAALNPRWVKRSGSKEHYKEWKPEQFPLVLSIVFRLNFDRPEASSVFLAILDRCKTKQFGMDDNPESEDAKDALKHVTNMWDKFLYLRQLHNPSDEFPRCLQRMGIDCFQLLDESPQRFLVQMVIECLKTWAGFISGRVLLDTSTHPGYDQLNSARFTERTLPITGGPDKGIFRVETTSWKMPLYDAQWMAAEAHCRKAYEKDLHNNRQAPGYSPSEDDLNELFKLNKFKVQKTYPVMQAAKSTVIDEVVGGRNILNVGNCLRNIHSWCNNLLLYKVLEQPPLSGHIYDLGTNSNFTKVGIDISDKLWEQLDAMPRAQDIATEKLPTRSGPQYKRFANILCYWKIIMKHCDNGDNCPRAHSIREMHPSWREAYKTKPCLLSPCTRGAKFCINRHFEDKLDDHMQKHRAKMKPEAEEEDPAIASESGTAAQALAPAPSAGSVFALPTSAKLAQRLCGDLFWRGGCEKFGKGDCELAHDPEHVISCYKKYECLDRSKCQGNSSVCFNWHSDGDRDRGREAMEGFWARSGSTSSPNVGSALAGQPPRPALPSPPDDRVPPTDDSTVVVPTTGDDLGAGFPPLPPPSGSSPEPKKQAKKIVERKPRFDMSKYPISNRLIDDNSRIKRMCIHYINGSCKNGDCPNAHGIHEIAPDIRKIYKMYKCEVKQKFCSGNGTTCWHIHPDDPFADFVYEDRLRQGLLVAGTP